MLKEQGNGGVGGRVCDTCREAASTVYCTADAAYLCGACDGRVHAANRVASRHERVWVCEACERAPAAFLCKADAASLCATCDADIHAANPLASRHHRVPIMPIPGCLYRPDLASMADTDDEEDEAASWLLLNPGKTNNNNNNNNGFLFGGEVVDEYLDLVEYNSCADQNQFNDQYNQQQQQQQYCVPQKNYGSGGDSVVPIQPKEQLQQQKQQQQQQQQQQSFHSGIDYKSAKDYSYSGSFNHNVSVSSMDVPEPAMSDISISHPRPPKGTIDLFSGPPIQMPTQLTPMDREARVLRYREKKKNRKFEKTIRYASRKAYAETRPRIKGRFAKRKETEVDVDQMFSTQMMMGEGGYGIVPSF